MIVHNKIMKYDPNQHDRRSIRLYGYDYSQEGAYFITICAQNRECLFGKIVDGKMILNDVGKMIDFQWNKLRNRFCNIQLGQYVVMPNHVHGIIIIKTVGAPLVGTRDVVNVQIEIGTNNGVGASTRAGTRPAPTNTKNLPIQNVGAPLVGARDAVDETNAGMRNVVGAKIGTRITIGNIIGAFKSITTHKYIIEVKNNNWRRFNGKFWQRNYYEHIIRGENDLLNINEYIANNPLYWEKDDLFVK